MELLSPFKTDEESTMNRSLPQPAVTGPTNNQRLVSRLASNMSINPKQQTTTSRIMPAITTTLPFQGGARFMPTTAGQRSNPEIDTGSNQQICRPPNIYLHEGAESRKVTVVKMKSRPKKNDRIQDESSAANSLHETEDISKQQPQPQHQQHHVPQVGQTDERAAQDNNGDKNSPKIYSPAQKCEFISNPGIPSTLASVKLIQAPTRPPLSRPLIKQPTQIISSSPPNTSQLNSSPTKFNQQPIAWSPRKSLLLEQPPPCKSTRSMDLDGQHVSTNLSRQSNGDSVTPKAPQNSSTKIAPQQLPFTWETYLKLTSSEPAPKEAFTQSQTPLVNQFAVGMKLAAVDPRNTNSWCLATVVLIEGPRLKLRFDGGDNSNDFFELIDSDNIRAVGLHTGDTLFPPMAYKGNLSSYPKYVEKILSKPDTVVAPPQCFINPPLKPKQNLFKKGMKLEAIDRKHQYLIYPASVGDVHGADLNIVFDGWSGSFDYTCRYYSREIFPVNWCRDNNHYLSPPNGWGEKCESAIPKKSDESVKQQQNQQQQNKKVSPRVKSASCPSKKRAFDYIGRIRTSASNMNKTTSNTAQSSSEKSKIINMELFSDPKAPALNARDLQKKAKKRREEEQDEIQENGSSDLNDDIDLDQDLGSDPYQCQRAVPYTEWLKTKVDVKSAASEVSFEGSTGSDANVFNNGNSVSLDTLESRVILSPPDTVALNQQTNPKKVKMDDDFASRLSTIEKSSDDNTSNLLKHYSSWSVRDVIRMIKSDESLAKYSSVFEANEIDGKALALLTTDVMINHMGLKIGPVLKINDLIEQMKGYK